MEVFLDKKEYSEVLFTQLESIEIVSPGGLPNGLTNEDIFTGRSEVRNRMIARVSKN